MDDLISTETAANAAYIVAALLFILALAGLSRHETAKVGNTFGIFGMAIALVATIASPSTTRWTHWRGALLIAAMSIGAAIGLWRARVGGDDRHARADRAAAQLRRSGRRAGRLERLPGGRARPRQPPRPVLEAQDLLGVHTAEVFIGVFIGAVTFTGSIVAFLKLSARIEVGAADAAGQEPAQPRRPGVVRRR